MFEFALEGKDESMNHSDIEKLKKFQAPVLEELGALERSIEESLECDIPLASDVCSYLKEGRGKRIRPTVLFLAARSLGGSKDDLVTSGMAIELIHTATLIHDDILDGHDFRRNRPTVYARWGTKTATIIGDFLYTKAFSSLADARLFEVMDILAKVTNTICVGEILQLEQRNNLDLNEQNYIDIISKKTASLFSASCECGAVLAGEKNGNREIYSDFGMNIGLAFQITDDIFDYIADEEAIGKPVGSDFSDGRFTLPFIKAFVNAPNAAQKKIEELVGVDQRRQSKWPEIVSFVKDYGGVEYSIEMARGFGTRAKGFLSRIKPSLERDALAMAADYIVERVNGF